MIEEEIREYEIRTAFQGGDTVVIGDYWYDMNQYDGSIVGCSEYDKPDDDFDDFDSFWENWKNHDMKIT